MSYHCVIAIAPSLSQCRTIASSQLHHRYRTVVPSCHRHRTIVSSLHQPKQDGAMVRILIRVPKKISNIPNYDVHSLQMTLIPVLETKTVKLPVGMNRSQHVLRKNEFKLNPHLQRFKQSLYTDIHHQKKSNHCTDYAAYVWYTWIDKFSHFICN